MGAGSSEKLFDVYAWLTPAAPRKIGNPQPCNEGPFWCSWRRGVAIPCGEAIKHTNTLCWKEQTGQVKKLELVNHFYWHAILRLLSCYDSCILILACIGVLFPKCCKYFTLCTSGLAVGKLLYCGDTPLIRSRHSHIVFLFIFPFHF